MIEAAVLQGWAALALALALRLRALGPVAGCPSAVRAEPLERGGAGAALGARHGKGQRTWPPLQRRVGQRWRQVVRVSLPGRGCGGWRLCEAAAEVVRGHTAAAVAARAEDRSRGVLVGRGVKVERQLGAGAEGVAGALHCRAQRSRAHAEAHAHLSMMEHANSTGSRSKGCCHASHRKFQATLLLQAPQHHSSLQQCCLALLFGLICGCRCRCGRGTLGNPCHGPPSPAHHTHAPTPPPLPTTRTQPHLLAVPSRPPD